MVRTAQMLNEIWFARTGERATDLRAAILEGVVREQMTHQQDSQCKQGRVHHERADRIPLAEQAGDPAKGRGAGEDGHVGGHALYEFTRARDGTLAWRRLAAAEE